MQNEFVIDDALFLDQEHKSFKGRDGNMVNYTKVRLLTDKNDFIEATASQDADFSEIPPRTVGRATIEVTERDNKIKRRLTSFE